MLKNLKDSIDPIVLQNFNVGSIDAWDDKLLSLCFCETRPFSTFLNGNFEFLVGPKGAGKSAIFRLISEGEKSFNNPKKLDQIIVSIYETTEYSSLRTLVSEKLNLSESQQSNALFFFWEIYILYRILIHLRKEYRDIFLSLDNNVNDFLSYFEDSKKGFFDFLNGIKGSAGVKLDITNPNYPIPDFYISAEKSPDIKTDKQIDLIKLDSIKKSVCKILKGQKSVIYVLVDNLDDFASREEFTAQKSVIQGLTETCLAYTKFPEIKIKASLRTELYEKLNFPILGGRDKIQPRIVTIKWDADDIRFFIGERLIPNIIEYCVKKGKHLGVEIDENHLYRPHQVKTGFIDVLVNKFHDVTNSKWKKEIQDTRTVDESDQIYQDIITSLFPRCIMHYSSSGKEINGESIFDYLETHFCFAGGNSTPRIHMRFLTIVFEIATRYYIKNKTISKISLNEKNEYPIIKKTFINKAYKQLQEESHENCISSVSFEPWKKAIALLLRKRGNRTRAGSGLIKKWIDIDDNDEVREFIAYCLHLGILQCENKEDSFSKRMYAFPILFQKIINISH